MEDQLIFLIGSPRSGTTMLARMIGAHSEVHAPGEPHLMTGLAHLGYFAKVDAAPYDPRLGPWPGRGHSASDRRAACPSRPCRFIWGGARTPRS